MGLEERTNLRCMAKIASRGLFAPRSLTPDEIRAICATALMNVPDHRQAAMVEDVRAMSRSIWPSPWRGAAMLPNN